MEFKENLSKILADFNINVKIEKTQSCYIFYFNETVIFKELDFEQISIKELLYVVYEQGKLDERKKDN